MAQASRTKTRATTAPPTARPRTAESIRSAQYIPTTPVELPEDRAAEVAKLVDALEQDEDVQKVFHNMA